jgi:hypothetical protein
MRYSHVFAFDTEDADKMLVDDASGSIKTALNLINKDINNALVEALGSNPLDLEALESANKVLL